MPAAWNPAEMLVKECLENRESSSSSCAREEPLKQSCEKQAVLIERLEEEKLIWSADVSTCPQGAFPHYWYHVSASGRKHLCWRFSMNPEPRPKG